MSEEQAEKKNKKINKMTLEELNKAIEKTEENMGGLHSKYGRELLKQKAYLESLKK